MTLAPATRERLWYARVGHRLRAHWRLKAIGVPSFIAVFFVGYFLLLKFPVFPATIMPLTPIDRLIDFSPGALPLYASLWLYIQFAPGVLDDLGELISYACAASVLSLVGFAVFFFWPTAIPTAGVDWTRNLAFAHLETIAGGNACPSLHVTFAIFSAIWAHRLLRHVGGPAWTRSLNWWWCAGIVYSTLATKQHVALDVVAGGALGWAGAVIHLRATPRCRRDGASDASRADRRASRA